MEEEVIEVGQPSSSSDRDGQFLFDTTVLESLNKLTDEIQEGLLTDGDSEIASDSYDSDEYTDDDEDPDSGENKLFNMMDDLVMELQLEMNSYDPSPVIEATTDNSSAVDINDVADADQEEENQTTSCQLTSQNETTMTDLAEGKEENCVSTPPTKESVPLPQEVDNNPSMNRTNISLSEHERAEKQRKLHTQVKMLLHQVTMLAELSEPEQEQENEVAVGLATGDRRKRGDSSADKLEQLLGVLSSYSTPTEGPADPTDDIAAAAAPSPAIAVSENQAKTARAMSSYTQRKRRQYLLRKQEAATKEGNNMNGGRDIPATVTPPSNKGNVGINPKQKKRRPRTNKHQKGKHKKSSPDASELRYQQFRQRDRIQRQRQQQSYYAQPPSSEPIPLHSLRALLSQLLALEERLSRDQVMV